MSLVKFTVIQPRCRSFLRAHANKKCDSLNEAKSEISEMSIGIMEPHSNIKYCKRPDCIKAFDRYIQLIKENNKIDSEELSNKS